MFSKCDTSLLLRALSIFIIVANHFGFFSVAGGALYLIALSGFNFIRFTLVKFDAVPGYPNELPFSRFFNIYFRFVGKLIIPTCLYTLFIYIVIGKFFIFGLLLISNFWGPDYAEGLSYWFLEVLLQIYLLFSVVMVIKPLRIFMAKRPFEFFLFLSLLTYGIARICLFLFDTQPLLNRLPHLLLYVFVMGGLVTCSSTMKQKIVASCTISLVCIEGLIQNFGDMFTFMYFALIATLWVPSIHIPNVFYIPVRVVAMSSLFIYLSHFQTHRFLEKAFGEQHPGVPVLAALVVGIILSSLWQRRSAFWFKIYSFSK